jgi:hypothetical protein
MFDDLNVQGRPRRACGGFYLRPSRFILLLLLLLLLLLVPPADMKQSFFVGDADGSAGTHSNSDL